MPLDLTQRLAPGAGGAGANAPIDSDPESRIPRTRSRLGTPGKELLRRRIPADLRRQWIQGTGPAAKPNEVLERSIRNVAYALLSGADGWMFDGEDALGQISTMSLDNQRNLKLAIGEDPLFLQVAERVAEEMNTWAGGFLGRPIVTDWKKQLAFTTKIFRARGLHLDDRHVRWTDGRGFSASIVDVVLYVVHNYEALRRSGASLVLYLPKIQTAEEAALWSDILSALEEHLGLPDGTVKTYERSQQLRPASSSWRSAPPWGHAVSFNLGAGTINSVSDAMR
jgi:malate synthase